MFVKTPTLNQTLMLYALCFIDHDFDNKAKQYINNTVYIHNGTSLLKYALRDTLGISKGCQQVGKPHNNG
jgi:hypothetical protein